MNGQAARVMISVIICFSVVFTLMVGEPDIIDGIIHMMMRAFP